MGCGAVLSSDNIHLFYFTGLKNMPSCVVASAIPAAFLETCGASFQHCGCGRTKNHFFSSAVALLLLLSSEMSDR